MKTSSIHHEPQLSVGILTSPSIAFSLSDSFQVKGSSQTLPAGTYTASPAADGRVMVCCDGDHRGQELTLPPSAVLEPLGQGCFWLEQVRIGLQFHWERLQRQQFEGSLCFLHDGHGQLVAINLIGLESYLYSVIASEMNAASPEELLKAHAIISRSWLLAQLRRQDSPPETAQAGAAYPMETVNAQGEKEHIRWYERDAHLLFDVCADDHCQRYQGIAHSDTPQVRAALQATHGQVLSYGDEICDARFYKCCGGMTESFENCWAPEPHPYLRPVRDLPRGGSSQEDYREEQAAREFILGAPPAFCHTTDQRILSLVLNNYDQETRHFYRWTVRYTAEELSEIVRQRSGIDFGRILALQPVERGRSGRIVKLRIVGDKQRMIIGKELEIRKFLSRTHLYSSAFVVDTEGLRASDGAPEVFVLHGAGWGHGAGLCQIGAAVMSSQGYSHRQILSHYYPDTTITQLY